MGWITKHWDGTYLTDRCYTVVINGTPSGKQCVICGLPQVSCAGTLCFLAYLSPLYDSVTQLAVHYESYANGTQVYNSFRPIPEMKNLIARLLYKIALTSSGRG